MTMTAAFFGMQAVGSLIGGIQQQAAYKAQAAFQDVQTKQLMVQGAKEAADIKKRLVETQALQTAYYASSGIDITAGSPMDVRARAQQEGDEALDVSRLNTAVGVDASRGKSAMLRAAGSQALTSGIFKAAGSLIGAYDDLTTPKDDGTPKKRKITGGF